MWPKKGKNQFEALQIDHCFHGQAESSPVGSHAHSHLPEARD